MRRLLIGVIFCAVLGSRLGAKDRDLTGVYLCEGQNADGKTYYGLVDVQQTAATYHLRWFFQGGTLVYGVGFMDRGALIVGSGRGEFLSVAVYTVGKDTLKGAWTMQGSGSKFTETLTKAPPGVTIPHLPPQHPPVDDGPRTTA